MSRALDVVTLTGEEYDALLDVRAATIEECAKLCERQMFDGFPIAAHRRGFSSAKAKCAAAIRALAPEPQKEGKK